MKITIESTTKLVTADGISPAFGSGRLAIPGMKLHPYVSLLAVANWPNVLEMPCGAFLFSPQLAEPEWDAGTQGLPEFNSLRDCRKCSRAADENLREGRRYVYWIAEGQKEGHEAALH